MNQSNEISCEIPNTISMLNIIGTNDIIPNSRFDDDGYIYVDNKRVCKWNTTFDGIVIWKPKMNDLPYLYDLYNRTYKRMMNHWNVVLDILKQLRNTATNENEIVKAHCIPTHKFNWDKNTDPWWEYRIKPESSFSFEWLDEKPEKVENRELGELLYKNYLYNSDLSFRNGKVQKIFFAAMKKSLPQATEDKVLCLKFGEDTFWFYTERVRNGFQWKMFNDIYKFEIKEMI